MLISIAAYALFWGWRSRSASSLLLLVHELGHYSRRSGRGCPSAPMFIPFLGALITLKKRRTTPGTKRDRDRAGPIARRPRRRSAVWGVGESIDSQLLVALAFTGFFLNLFNLSPISPLDGGFIWRSIKALRSASAACSPGRSPARIGIAEPRCTAA